MSRVSIRVFGEELQLVRPGDVAGLTEGMRMTPSEAAWAIESQTGDMRGRDVTTVTDLARLLGNVPQVSGYSMPSAGVRVCSALVDALRCGRVLAFRTARPTVVERKNKIERLGWVEDVEEADDVYVLAAAVKQLGVGDLPWMHQRVRILDPDTGEAVTGVLMTDALGVVRTEVPEAKVYRIEILEEDFEPEGPASEPDEEPAVLRCLFVDTDGEPIPDLAVVAHLDDGCCELMTNEDGEIEAPAHLAHYRLEVGAQTFDAHAVLARDGGDDARFYRFVVASASQEDETSDTDDDRLGRFDDGDDDDLEGDDPDHDGEDAFA